MENKISKPSEFQVVTVLWGKKYSAGLINYMAKKTAEFSKAKHKFFCITTLPLDSFSSEVTAVAMPEELTEGQYLEKRPGCMQKLAMFKPGLLPAETPTIYLDIDCLIKGDLSALAKRVESSNKLIIMKNHLVPTWRFAKAWQKFAKNYNYFGNGSIIGYMPKDWHQIYEKFLECFKQEKESGAAKIGKHFSTDERFVSWCARENLECWRAWEATRFQREYFFPLFSKGSDIINALPWKKSLRENTVVVTFDGGAIKPEILSKLKSGDHLRMKWRRYIWRNEDFTTYWKEALKNP